MVKGDKKREDDPKSGDKDSSTGGTAGAHIGNTPTLEESAASNKGASIGAHVSETNGELSRPSRTVEEIL